MTATFLLVLLPFLVCVLSFVTQKSELFSAGPDRSRELEEKINELLPQTQCGKCDYEGCRPYAGAIASRQADFNHCPPGGDETIARIASLLGEDTKPLKSTYAQASRTEVAVIDETLCIGCVLCIRACPVDAIIGAAKQMHAVIESACTGCELCIPPCPVDCITMVPCR